MSLGNRIMELRKTENMSRQELAETLEISYSALSKYETNERFPDQDMLKRISKFFKCSIDYLLGETSIKNNTIYSNSAFHLEDSEGLTEDEIQIVNDLIQSMKKRKLGK